MTLLGEEGAGLCASRAFVFCYAHVNLCHLFSSSWCQGLAATSASGSSWTFLFTFFTLFIIYIGHNQKGTESGVKTMSKSRADVQILQ